MTIPVVYCALIKSEHQSLKKMATITLQIPEELAQRLEPLQNRLPELLWQLLEITKKPTTILDFGDRL